MTSLEFLLTYTIGGAACAIAGYLLGAMRSETKSEQMRRWWFERENRLNSRQRK